VVVGVAVVFTNLPDKSLILASSGAQESLFNREKLFFEIFWGAQFVVARGQDQQELFVVILRGRQTDKCENRSDATVHLIFEVRALQVFNNNEVGMADPGVDQPFIKFDRFFYCLVPCLVVVASVKLFSAVSSRDQVNDCFVAFVSELDSVPGRVVEKCLPYVVVSICHSVHNTSIAEKHGLRVGCKGSLQEDVLQGHLHRHQLNLKLHCIRKGHLACLDKRAALHKHCCRFWHL